MNRRRQLLGLEVSFFPDRARGRGEKPSRALGEGISREVKNGEAEGDKIEEGEDTAAPHTKLAAHAHTRRERERERAHEQRGDGIFICGFRGAM